MIPLILELKNFLSYGEQRVKIDFTDHSLICLSGKNGNGKSAILDAITWALWGQARKVSGNTKADAGLMRLGQTRMMVSLEFLCGGQKYRVRREYSKTYGKAISSLDFHLCKDNSNLDSFVSLTEKTVRNTQEKIEKVVGLDFETFVNSAFLRQGQSNEFSQKTPKERKQILANILGLSLYDDYSKRSLEHSRRYAQESKVLEKVEEQVVKELEKECEVIDSLKEKNKNLDSLDSNIKKTQKELEQKEKEKLLIVEHKYHLEQQEKEEKMIRQALGLKRDELSEYISVWRRVHALSINSPNLKLLEEERKKLFDLDVRFRSKQQEEINLKELFITKKERYQNSLMICQNEYEKKLQEASIKLEKARLSCQHNLSVHKQKKDSCTKIQDKQKENFVKLEKIEKELSSYKIFQKEFESCKNQFEKRRVFYQNLVHRGNLAKRDIKELEQKRDAVQDIESPSCPLCEQVLTIRRKQFLARVFTGQESFLQHRLNRVSQILKKLKVLLFEQHSQIKKLTFKDDSFKQLQANKDEILKVNIERLQELKRESMACDVLQAQVSSEEKIVINFEKELECKKKEKDSIVKKDEKIIKLLQELEELEKKKKSLGYDKKNHDKILQQLNEIQKKLQDLDSLKSQLAQQEQRKELVARCMRETKDLKKKLLVLETKRKAFVFDYRKEKVLFEKINEIQINYKKLVKEKDVLLQEKGSLETKRDRFTALKKEQKERAKKREELLEQAKEYQVLAKMFGRDGIQALLIEQAIPEIEQEANKLLSQLTDNKSQIFIESLRDLKKGGAKESLDIHISDASGMRAYELFSGGEAFRIDFSLRIAISKLLARRAGTALQTLIIDEGFGSQDEDGLQRLMDAIYAIQKDFEKIIVVSHLPVFKNNFPVHFVVDKNSLGSFVSVEERG